MRDGGHLPLCALLGVAHSHHLLRQLAVLVVLVASLVVLEVILLIDPVIKSSQPAICRTTPQNEEFLCLPVVGLTGSGVGPRRPRTFGPLVADPLSSA